MKIRGKAVSGITALLLAVAILAGLAGCRRQESGAITYEFKTSEIKDIVPVAVDEKLHAISSLEYIAKTGLIELYLDKLTFAPAVKETLQNKLWYALPKSPEEGEGKYYDSAAVVTLKVVDKNRTYYLNSQDHSVAFGTAAYTKDTGGMTVKYTIAPDRATAQKKEFTAGDIAFSVSVSYILKDGSLYISCSNNNLADGSTAVIETLGLLEYFGASAEAAEGDFILVPDGCGALIQTAVIHPGFNPLKLSVYGNDAGLGASDDSYAAVVPAFGVKQGGSAFAVIIEKGDALAKITADRATENGGANRVGTQFTITGIRSEKNGENTVRHISKNPYKGTLNLCVRFVAGSNATYSGLAAVCREQFIRNGTLSTKTVEPAAYLPFNLMVDGAVRKTILNDVQINYAALTTFDQALDIVTRMKAKGIDSVFLRYKGALSGGLNQTDVSQAGFLRKLGSGKNRIQLYDYIAAQKMEFYLDINLISFGSGLFRRAPDGAKTLLAENAVSTGKNTYYPFVGSESFDRNLRSKNGLRQAVIKVLENTRNTEITGFCLNDAGNLLYSDFSADGANRQEMASLIAERTDPLSTDKRTMIDTGNFYMLKNADVIVNMPMQTAFKETDAYKRVPFIQMIMHGVVDYSGAPINFADNIQDTVLRFVEYGACPAYEWCGKNFSDGGDGEFLFYYDDWINQAAGFYAEANEALCDLRGKRLLRHYEDADNPGVFCAEYEGDTRIYVNYTEVNVETGGFTVKAKDFLRIN